MAVREEDVRVAFAHQRLEISGTPTGFTDSIINPEGQVRAKEAVLDVEAGTGRMRVFIGQTLTRTIGQLISVGDIAEISGNQDITNFKAISITDRPLVIHGDFFR